MYLKLVNWAAPTGPRACILPVEIPISAPIPILGAHMYGAIVLASLGDYTGSSMSYEMKVFVKDQTAVKIGPLSESNIASVKPGGMQLGYALRCI